MSLVAELGLREGEKLVNHRSWLGGFMQNEDIDEYDIIDADGRLIASVKITLHSDVKAPFKTTRSVQRTDRWFPNVSHQRVRSLSTYTHPATRRLSRSIEKIRTRYRATSAQQRRTAYEAHGIPSKCASAKGTDDVQ